MNKNGISFANFLTKKLCLIFFHPVLGSFSVADFLDENLDPAVNSSSPGTTGPIFFEFKFESL